MPSKVQSILIAAVVGAVLATFASLFTTATNGLQYAGSALACLVAIAVPAIAVWHYTDAHKLTLKAGAGAGLGAMASVAAGVLGTILSRALQAVGLTPSTEEMLELQRQQMASQGMPPEQIAQMMEFVEMSTGPAGIAVGIVIGALVGAGVGAVAASVFKKGPPAESF